MIEHIKCSTPDFAVENAKKLLALFPECAGRHLAEVVEFLSGAETDDGVIGIRRLQADAALVAAGYIENAKLADLLGESRELSRILSASVTTKKKKIRV